MTAKSKSFQSSAKKLTACYSNWWLTHTDPLDSIPKHPQGGSWSTWDLHRITVPRPPQCLDMPDEKSHSKAQQVWPISAISSAEPARHTNLRDQNSILMYYDVMYYVQNNHPSAIKQGNGTSSNHLERKIGKSSITFDYQRIPVQDESDWNGHNGPHNQKVPAMPLARRAHEQSFVGSLGTAMRTPEPSFLQVMLWLNMVKHPAKHGRKHIDIYWHVAHWKRLHWVRFCIVRYL